MVLDVMMEAGQRASATHQSLTSEQVALILKHRRFREEVRV